MSELRHSRAHTLAARDRTVAEWRRRAKWIIESPSYTIQPGDAWAQVGRLSKMTLSCGDHAICRLYRSEKRFRVKRAAFNRARDLMDFE